jgi:hypothetical protein
MAAGQAGQGQPQSFKVFLSHRYKSAETNLRFFSLFSDAGKEVQFKVDEGSLRISMTRLERMVRDADCFVGLYPYPEAPEVRPSAASLRQASAYFRLELDLAVRSGKPAIVFYDQRYRAVLPRLPDAVSYDPQELAGHGGWPDRDRLAAAFTAFCDGVEAARTYQPRAPRERLRREARVGLLLPADPAPGAYTGEQLQTVKGVLDDEGLECVTVPLPEVITPEFLLEVWQLDWAVVDVAAPGSAKEVLAFLHGQFLPMLRLRRTAPDDDPTSSGPSPGHALFGGFDVGYPEDLHDWHDLDSLGAAVREGFAAIDRPEAYVGSIEDARQYFSRAEQRKEHVFLSYSGDDRAVVAPIADAFRRRFQTVYDYRQQSIPVGTSWFNELLGQVAVSPVGVPLLSSSYLTKPICLEEAERMATRRLQGEMTVLPVTLDDTTPPAVLETVQYIRAADFPDPAGLVEHLISRLPPDR